MLAEARLTMGERGGALEQAADRAAEQLPSLPPPGQGHGGVVGHRHPVGETLHSPGVPLDPSIRASLEARLDHDLSGVRVHTDARAAEVAEALGAEAFTVGGDVVFGRGRYAPRSPDGKRLLAHELAHVVQQTAGSAVLLQRQPAAEIETAPTPARRVIEALNRPQEIAGVGDLPAAFAILAELSPPELVIALTDLDNQGYLEALIGNFGASPGAEPRVLDLATSIHATRAAAPPPQLQAERQLAMITAAHHQAERAADAIRDLIRLSSTQPEKLAPNDIRALGMAIEQFRRRLGALRGGLLPPNSGEADRIDSLITNVDALGSDVDQAERQVRQFVTRNMPEKTSGEFYWSHIAEQEDLFKHNVAAGGAGYGWAGLNATEWLSSNILYAAADLVTSGTMGLEARNAWMYRTGQISYEAYSQNIWWNVGHGLLNLAITALTLGWGTGIAAGGDVTMTTVVTRGVAGGAAASMASDLYSGVAAGVSDVSGAQTYHEQMIAGPVGWAEAGLLGGLFAGVFGWAGGKLKQPPIRVPSGLARALPEEAVTGGALTRAEPSPPAPQGGTAIAPATPQVGPVVGESVAYEVVSRNPTTGDVTAIGRNPGTGEVAVMQVNLKTGDGWVRFMEGPSAGQSRAIARGQLRPLPAGLLPAGTIQLGPAERAPALPGGVPALPASTAGTDVWVNRTSRLFHPPGSPWYGRADADPNRGPHWQKMSRAQAVEEGFTEARWDPRTQWQLGAQREADFVQDYVYGGGRERNFGAPANPQAVHEQVTIYHRVVQSGTEGYVKFEGLASGTSEMARRLDVVDLTEPASPKVFEVGTATPSKSEALRKEWQLSRWEEATQEAAYLARTEGGDGRVYGLLENGTYVDLTGATYQEILLP